MLHILATKIAIYRISTKILQQPSNSFAKGLRYWYPFQLFAQKSKLWHLHLEVVVVTVEDQEEGIGVAFVEVEVVHLAVAVEVSRLQLTLRLLVSLCYMTVMSL